MLEIIRTLLSFLMLLLIILLRIIPHFDCLIYAGHCAKCFPCVILFNPYNNLTFEEDMIGLLLAPFYR